MVKHKQEVKKKPTYRGYRLDKNGTATFGKKVLQIVEYHLRYFKKHTCLHLLDITQDSSVISRTSKKGHMPHSLSITMVFIMSQIENTVLNLFTTASLGQNQYGRDVGIVGRFQQE